MNAPQNSSGAGLAPHLTPLLQGIVVLLVLLLLPAAPRCSRSQEGAFPAPFLAQWKTWTRADGLPADTVWVVLPVQGGVWAGTTNGLAFFDGKTFKVWRPEAPGGKEPGLVHRAVTSLAVDPVDGTLWIGTFGGVSHLTPKGFKNYTQATSGLVNDTIYAVAVQGDTIWMASANGLSGLDRRTGAFATYDDRNAPFHENWCYGATVVREKLYLSVWGGGLCIRDALTGEWQVHMDPDGDNRVDLLPDDGILSDVIVTASVHDERIWVASYFGAGMFDGHGWHAFTTANSGLARNFVNTVKASGDGCWVGTDDGLSYTDGHDLWVTYRGSGDRKEGEATLFRKNAPLARARTEGAPGANFVWSIAEDPASPSPRKVWLGTARGLSLGTEQGGQK